MAAVTLERERWRDYFDEMARAGRAREVYVEVADLHVGDQVEFRWLPLTGITFDPRSDVLEVITDPVDHMVLHPRRIDLEYDSEGLRNIEVTDADGKLQIIRLKEPMRLPAP